MFYELNTWDPFGSTPWKRSNDGPLQGTFDGDQDIFAQITLISDPDAHFSHGAIQSTAQLKVDVEATADVNIAEVPNILPDG